MRHKSGIAKYSWQLKGDLGAAIEAQKKSSVNYGSELCDIASLVKLFLHHKDKTTIINIIQKGSRYHLDPIPTRTDIDIKVGGARGGPGINTTTTRSGKKIPSKEIPLGTEEPLKETKYMIEDENDKHVCTSIGGSLK